MRPGESDEQVDGERPGKHIVEWGDSVRRDGHVSPTASNDRYHGRLGVRAKEPGHKRAGEQDVTGGSATAKQIHPAAYGALVEALAAIY
jgi:hypothetical protein